MRTTTERSGLWMTVCALGLLAWSAPCARADSILQYTTAGGPGASGIQGAPVISFVPVQNESVDTASNISLGTFVVAGLKPGESTTYDNTPFTLSLIPNSFNSTALTDNAIQIAGHLNGTVSGAYQSSVKVSFDSIASPKFAIGAGAGTLTLSNNQELLVPSSVNGGQTTLQAQVVTSGTDLPTPAPEPSTIALFLGTFGGLAFRKYALRRRKDKSPRI